MTFTKFVRCAVGFTGIATVGVAAIAVGIASIPFKAASGVVCDVADSAIKDIEKWMEEK